MKIIDIPKSILDLMRDLDTGASPWPTPEKLAKPLLPVMKFDPKKMLPPLLGDFCSDIAHRMQCPIDFVAVAVVSMLGSVIGTGCAVRPKQKDDWMEVPNLWGGVVGRPGRLKSPAISSGMASLRSLESDANKAFATEVSQYETQVITRKFETDFLKKRMGKANPVLQTDIDKLRELSQPLETPPRVRRFQTNDSTVEKLGEILTANARGLLVFRDELVGLLKSFEQQGHEADRGFYLEAWNGKYHHRVDRIGRGELFIPRLCVSLFGGIQPAKLQDYLYQTKVGGNDGFLQRFQLLVYPDDVQDPKIIDEEPNRVAADKVLEIVKKLANTDFSTVGATQEFENDIPYIRFEGKKAQPRFYAYLQALDTMTSVDDDPIVQEHFTKYRKLVPALALIFHLFEWTSSEKKNFSAISLRSLLLAIAWADYLATHARRIYGMGFDLSVVAAETLARKIDAHELADGFTERDVQRKGWANLSDQELVKCACQELEAAGWIRRRPLKKGGAGGRPAGAVYDINPKIWKK